MKTQAMRDAMWHMSMSLGGAEVGLLILKGQAKTIAIPSILGAVESVSIVPPLLVSVVCRLSRQREQRLRWSAR